MLTQLRHEAATWQLPVILVSTSKQYLERAEEEHVIWGGDRYLLKPFDLETLLQMIQDLIGSA